MESHPDCLPADRGWLCFFSPHSRYTTLRYVQLLERLSSYRYQIHYTFSQVICQVARQLQIPLLLHRCHFHQAKL
jgi:hypothetical protein